LNFFSYQPTKLSIWRGFKSKTKLSPIVKIWKSFEEKRRKIFPRGWILFQFFFYFDVQFFINQVKKSVTNPPNQKNLSGGWIFFAKDLMMKNLLLNN